MRVGKAAGGEPRLKYRPSASDPLRAWHRQGCAETLIKDLQRSPGESETIGRVLAVTAWPESLNALERPVNEGPDYVRDAPRHAYREVEAALRKRQGASRACNRHGLLISDVWII